MAGRVDVQLISAEGIHLKSQFEYEEKCNTGHFCSLQGAMHVPALGTSIGSTCKLQDCINMDQYLALKIVFALVQVDDTGSERVSLGVENLVTTDAFISIDGIPVGEVGSSAWESLTVFKFALPTLQLPCDACGHKCQCSITFQVHDTSPRRAASFRYEYASLLSSEPPIIKTVRPGCTEAADSACQDHSLLLNQQHLIFLELQNIPVVDASAIRLTLQDPEQGEISQIRIRVSSLHSTKVEFLYLPPPAGPEGLVTVFVSIMVRAAEGARVPFFLRLTGNKMPSVASIFPSQLAVNDDAIVHVTFRNWASGMQILSSSLSGCGESVPGLARMKQGADPKVMQMQVRFGQELIACDYVLSFNVAGTGGTGVSSKEVTTVFRVSDTPFLAFLSPPRSIIAGEDMPRSSVAGGDSIHLSIKNCPSVEDVEQWQVHVAGSWGTPAAQISVLWSTDLETRLIMTTPPADVPGVVQLKVSLISHSMEFNGMLEYTALPPAVSPSVASSAGGTKVTVDLSCFASAQGVEEELRGVIMLPSTSLDHSALRLVGGSKCQIDVTMPESLTVGPVTIQIQMGVGDDIVSWRAQTLVVEYFRRPTLTLEPSQASRAGGEIVTVKLFDFEPLTSGLDVQVRLGEHEVPIHALLSSDVLQFRVPADSLLKMGNADAEILLEITPQASMSGATREQKKASSAFLMRRATAKVASAVPCTADVAGGEVIELALTHFPRLDTVSQVSVSFGSDEASAVVLDLLHSDRLGAGLRVVTPPMAQSGASFGTVRAGSVLATFAFVFNDARVRVTCANVALASGEWCMGSVRGSDVILVSVTNFGKIEKKEDISVRFASVLVSVQEVVVSSMQLLTIKIFVPPVLGKSWDWDVDLTISNLVSDSEILAHSATTSFRYIASPFLASAVLEPHGGGMILGFSLGTKNGDDMEQTSCADLLSDECVSKLGSNARCVWKSASELQVRFGPNATININDLVSVRRNVVLHLSTLDTGLDRESVARLGPPAAAFVPSLSIFGPEQLGACDAIELSAGAIGHWLPGRLTFRWQCISCHCDSDETLSPLCAKLAATTGALLRLLPVDLPASNTYYTIAVTGTNFMGVSSKQHTKRVWRTSASIPMLSLSARQSCPKDENLIIKLSRTAFSGCAGSQAGQIELTWSQSAQGGETDGKVPAEYLAQAKNSPSLLIPGGSLPSGRYVFVVQAKVHSTPPQIAEAQVSVSILPSPLEAVIQGGNSIISKTTQFITLSASRAYGAPPFDLEAASASSMSVAWKCTTQGFPCRDVNDFSVLAFGNTATIQVDTNLLHAGSYTFELSITQHGTAIVRTTSVALTMDDAPSVAISSSGTMLKDGITWLNPQHRLILRETECATCSAFSWTVDGGRVFAPVETSERSLVIGAGLLQPGRRYHFTVTAFDNDATGRASLNVSIMTRPSGGLCSLRLPDLSDQTSASGSPVAFTAFNMLTFSELSGVGYEIFSDYPPDHSGCSGSSCGTLIASVSGSSEPAGQVPSAGRYLFVARLEGYYSAYKTSKVDEFGAEVSFNMVQTMDQDENRAVLRWDHLQDLDLWVYSKDKSTAVGWDMDTEELSASLAGGVVTLDVDNPDGKSGPETTQLLGISSGAVEIWINHYDDVFTQAEAEEAPATVDIYCHRCVDSADGQVKIGLVVSVAQLPADVVDGSNWWKVGELVAPAESDSAEQLEWKMCTLGPGCYESAETPAAARRKTRIPSTLHPPSPLPPKDRVAASRARHRSASASVRSRRFARHDVYRIDCSGFVALAEPLSYQFGYTADSSSFFFVPGVLAFKNMYLPPGDVQPIVKIQVCVFCTATYYQVTHFYSYIFLSLNSSTMMCHALVR